MRFLAVFILLLAPCVGLSANPESWRELTVGDSLKAAKTVFGEPREVRGNTLLFGPKGDLAEVVMQVEGEVVKGFTAHWKKPASGIFSEEVFEIKEPDAETARLPVRFLGQPNKGWLVENDREGRVLSLSVGKPWASKATLTNWATTVKKSWEEKK